MRSSRKARLLVTVAACVVLGSPIGLGWALPPLALGAESPYHYQDESMGAYEGQLHKHEIHAAAFNYVAHTLHLDLNDGRHVLVSYYPALTPKQVERQLVANHVPIVGSRPSSGKSEPVHHHLRYLLAAVVVIVILIVLLVLLLGRRRAVANGPSRPTDRPTSGSSSPEGPLDAGGGEPGSASPPPAEGP